MSEESMQQIPFHVPDIDESDIAGVTEVLRSRWLTTGDRCREFEVAFADTLSPGGGLHAIAVNSGTSAMHLALEACGIGPSHRVIVPVMTFTATAEVVRYLGADPVFVDVSNEDSNLVAGQVAARVDSLPPAERDSIRALMPVHYGGRACDMQALCELAAERGWRVIDDAAHALPATSGSQMIGSLGDATAFSFYATKTLCTGEGGMVVTADEQLAARMKVMRLHGISRDAFDRYRGDGAGWAYEIVAPGFKYNLTDIAAALGLSQLARLQSMTTARTAVADRYNAGFAGNPALTLPPGPREGQQHSWHLYALRIRGGRQRRDEVIDRLAAGGISTSVHFIPLHHMPYWRDRYDLQATDFPNAEEIFSGQISLPIYPGLDASATDRVVGAVLSALEATA
ncbi:UDP-4-amino-4,6-dideoxy-N-acetyl-beta-L-altrosamine transaminase [bacterium]|nr:MAG: UDP-4-amino-4,6-dideoxy-N-acetyl-beta-L-altrosamine transaminase [bacterium]